MAVLSVKQVNFYEVSLYRTFLWFHKLNPRENFGKLNFAMSVLNNVVFQKTIPKAIFLSAFRRLIAFFCLLGVSGAVLFFLPQNVQAVSKKGYEAMQVVGGGTIALQPGEEKTVMIGFQNIGEKTWLKEGTGFVSIYTYEPKYRTSVFTHKDWYKPTQPTRLQEDQVSVGSVGHFLIPLQAPKEPGTYKETFHMAAEDTAWIPGGQFVLTLTVKQTDQQVSSVSSTSIPEGYAATVLLKSAKKITAKAGEKISFTAGIKNTGTISWKKRTVQMPDVAIASVSSYKDVSWVDDRVLVAKADMPVEPGGLDLMSFQFLAPRTKGTHMVRFVLAADGITVPGGEIDIPVEVTTNAPTIIQEEKQESLKDGEIMEEPMMRIGILTIDEETGFTAEITCDNDFDVRDGNGNLLAEMKAGENVSAFYKKMKYWFNRGKGIENTSYYLRFLPRKENAVCTVVNFDRRKTRKAAYADNQFRNILELRYSEEKDVVWLINELPIEMYLRGLAETSNISPEEFKKALITVARTYALYHWERGTEKLDTTESSTKHADEYFHLNAYADDQVYKGYGYEERNPLIGKAVEETRGAVVTYQGETAITPYFSRSDGRTRDWSEVWGGSVAWLTSVPVPWDQGKTLWGHGVGMSATGALAMAKEGKTWKEILQYFYQGIELVERWE